ncbi:MULTISPECIES: TIGR02301 family protein [Pseudovibrio]|uniref:TIGR02301 family protein n=1 Tax=Stappiaceae TaxID=2821832 RepID=UPI002366E762|nr:MULTISPECIES: TIGR02301 family protein [Pseudovibrio]MDD7911211.1 TIGR02301 family protein [Pseudovibrio exalbescens]MDX5593102.1 TIGR02301 family protein [Pseudovibrio sp. SPO723]
MTRAIKQISLALAVSMGLLAQAPVDVAHAQSNSEASESQNTDPKRPKIEVPPYEADLMRLAEILGALHYLRPLCGYDEKEEWSGRMQALLSAEVTNELRRRRFVERFNQGYRGFASVYQRCTPSAEEASRRYAAQGSKITQEVTAKYSRD